MRLDKYLAETAQCTRSEAKTMLAKGRVQVNGAVCKKGDTQLKDTDTVAVDGALLTYQKFVYLMLNKPEGVVSASTDKRDTTVVDLVGDAYPRRDQLCAGREIQRPRLLGTGTEVPRHRYRMYSDDDPYLDGAAAFSERSATPPAGSDVLSQLVGAGKRCVL